MDTALTDDRIQTISEDYGVISLPYGPMIINLHDSLLPTNLKENQQEIAELCQYARGAVVDVGANIGTHSINFGRVADVVYAFEPQPRIFYNLCANLLINHVKNVVPFNMALGSFNGVTSVPALDPTQPGSPMGVWIGAGNQPTPIQTLDSLAISPVNFIKIDVEGHELQVIKGAYETLRREKPIVYVEIHLAELIDQVRSYMHNLGYLDRELIEVHTRQDAQDVILTWGYLFWEEGRVIWQKK